MSAKEIRAHEPSETLAPPESRHGPGQADSGLRAQRAELARMMTELRELQESIKQRQSADTQILIQENEELRRQLADYEHQLAEARHAPSGESPKEFDALKSENALLRQLLEEKGAEAPIMRQQGAQPEDGTQIQSENVDLDSMEAELNRYRRQLEADRVKLNKEIEQLRTRNEELDDATREMEMAMSKERAELARERIRLDRMREEVRNDVERAQREGGLRESLASVNKLRDSGALKNGAG